MGHRLLLGLGAIGAVVACLWFAGAGEWLGITASDGDSARGRGADLLGDSAANASGSGGAGAATEEGDAASPSLFGQSRLARIGVGSLRGRVMDFDAGKPVPEALLVLEGTANEGVSVAARARTDANGRFVFPEVRAGDAYRLQVQAERHPERLIDAVPVTAGAEADLGDIWLGGRGLLEGRVVDADGQGIADATVRVHRGAASPMDWMRDVAGLYASLDRDAPALAIMQSNEEGRFRIADVEPGRITLVVRAAGFGQAMTDVMMTPTGVAGEPLVVVLDARPPLRGIVVDEAGRGVGRARVAVFQPSDFAAMALGRVFVESGPDGKFEVPAPPTLEGLGLIAAAQGYATLFQEVPPGASELRVVLTGGAQLLVRLTIDGGRASPAGASVSIFFEGKQQSSSGGLASGVTDARGELRLAGRPGPLAGVFVRHPDVGSGLYSPQSMGEFFKDSALRGPEEFTLVAGENTLELTLGEGQSVVGHVRNPDGGPLAGVRLAPMGFMAGGGESATSAADGSYALRTTGPLFGVIATLPGYVQQAGITGMMMFGGNEEEKRDAAGRRVMDVVMEPAGVLGGRVVDEAGRPVAGAEVVLAGSHGAALGMFAGKGGTTTTNAAGRYLLDGVKPESAVKATASCAGYVSATSAGVELKAGGSAEAPDIVLGRGATLRVAVESPRGQPMAGARVQVDVKRTDGVEEQFSVMNVLERNHFGARTTGAAGTVEFKALPSGTVTLSATATGTAGVRYVLELGAEKNGATHELLLSLRPSTSLEGRVVDESGKALASVQVEVDADPSQGPAGVMSLPGRPEQPVRTGPVDDWIPGRLARTDDEGRFRLADLPQGELSLKFTHDGHNPLQMPWSRRGDGGDFRLVARSAENAARLAQIEVEYAAVIRDLTKAETEEERSAAMARLSALTEERNRLEEGK